MICPVLLSSERDRELSSVLRSRGLEAAVKFHVSCGRHKRSHLLNPSANRSRISTELSGISFHTTFFQLKQRTRPESWRNGVLYSRDSHKPQGLGEACVTVSLNNSHSCTCQFLIVLM